MAKVLIIWNEIPEDVYLIEVNTDPDTMAKLASWHNHYVNGVDTPNEVAEAINEFFYDNAGEFRFPKNKETIHGGNFDLVVAIGFVL